MDVGAVLEVHLEAPGKIVSAVDLVEVESLEVDSAAVRMAVGVSALVVAVVAVRREAGEIDLAVAGAAAHMEVADLEASTVVELLAAECLEVDLDAGQAVVGDLEVAAADHKEVAGLEVSVADLQMHLVVLDFDFAAAVHRATDCLEVALAAVHTVAGHWEAVQAAVHRLVGCREGGQAAVHTSAEDLVSVVVAVAAHTDAVVDIVAGRKVVAMVEEVGKIEQS